MPRDMRQYLSNYGWHFNQRMLDWAVSMMRDKDGKPIKPYTRETLEAAFKAAGGRTEDAAPVRCALCGEHVQG